MSDNPKSAISRLFVAALYVDGLRARCMFTPDKKIAISQNELAKLGDELMKILSQIKKEQENHETHT